MAATNSIRILVGESEQFKDGTTNGLTFDGLRRISPEICCIEAMDSRHALPQESNRYLTYFSADPSGSITLEISKRSVIASDCDR